MITEKKLAELEACDEFSLQHYGAEVQDLIDSYRALQWVDCKERLPKAGQVCLLYRPDAPKTQDPVYRTAMFNGEHFACYVQPSHWMPLTCPMILSKHTISVISDQPEVRT